MRTSTSNKALFINPLAMDIDRNCFALDKTCATAGATSRSRSIATGSAGARDPPVRRPLRVRRREGGGEPARSRTVAGRPLTGSKLQATKQLGTVGVHVAVSLASLGRSCSKHFEQERYQVFKKQRIRCKICLRHSFSFFLASVDRSESHSLPRRPGVYQAYHTT